MEGEGYYLYNRITRDDGLGQSLLYCLPERFTGTLKNTLMPNLYTVARDQYALSVLTLCLAGALKKCHLTQTHHCVVKFRH